MYRRFCTLGVVPFPNLRSVPYRQVRWDPSYPRKILLNLLDQKISRLQILNYASGEIRNELNNFWLEP